MRRRVAMVLAVLWIGVLVAVDVWFVAEFRVAEAHLNRALATIFAAPVSFGDLSLGRFGDVVVSDVRLMRPDHPTKLYGTIDEVRVAPRWLKLLTQLELEVRDIAVTNPTLVVKWHPAERTFDMPTPLREGLERKARTTELPEIALKGLTLVLENPPDVVKQRQNFTFDNLSVTLSPEGSERWLYRFEVDVDHPILGRMSGFGRFSQDAFVVELKRHGLMVTPYLLGVVKDDVKRLLEQFLVSGDLTVTASVGPVPGGTAEAFSATVECHGMSVQLHDWPQALTDLRGRIDYSQGKITAEGLTGQFENAPLLVRATFDLGGGRKIVDASGEIVRLGINNGLASRLRKLPEPCVTVAEQIEAWDPDGTANVKFTLLQERDENQKPGPLQPFIEVAFNGGTNVRYIGHFGDDGARHGFAYPLQELRGVIRFTDKEATFDRLTAMNGSLAVEAHGTINYERGGDETYDVDVDARGLRMDGRISEALQGPSRELFNSLDADGGADLAVAIKRQKGEPPGARVDITVDLGGVGLRPRTLPIEFADARGRVVITDAGPIKIENVTARRAGGSITLSGVVPVSRGGPTLLSLDIGVEKFPVDAGVTAALGELAPGPSEVLSKLNPVGRIDGTLHVAALPDGSIGDLRGAIRFDEMTLGPGDPAVRIDDLGGSLTIAPSLVTINPGTTARIAGERFAVEGTINTDTGFDVRVEAEGFQIDRELVTEIEPLVPWIRGIDPRPDVDGKMSLALKLKGTAEEPLFSAEIDLVGVDVSHGVLGGLRLEGLHGHVSVSEAGAVSCRALAARIPLAADAPGASGAGESRPAITLNVAAGAFEPGVEVATKDKKTTKTTKDRMKLTGVSLHGIEITPGLIAMLPVSDEMKAKLDRLSLTAAVDLVLGSIEMNGDEFRVRKSQLKASRFAIGSDRLIAAESLTIGDLGIKAGGGLFELDGGLYLRDAMFHKIPVPALDGRIAADAEGIRLEALDGDLYGYEENKGQKHALGKIYREESRFEIRFADGSFDTHLRLQDVNLPATIRTLGGDPGKVSGTFRSLIDLDGTIDDVGTYRGRGDLSVRARNVVSLPVFYKMFNSLDVLSLFEKKDPWTNVEIDFAVKNRVLEMPRMKIDSPDVLLVGPGTLTFAGVIKADLKSNQTLGISPIGWVTKIISSAVFAGVRIEGPIGDPRVNAYSVAGG
jgi:hypothetical protein